MSEETYVVIVKCKDCHEELNRATGVPKSKLGLVTIQAPMMAMCRERGHSSLSDVNWNIDIEEALEESR